MKAIVRIWPRFRLIILLLLLVGSSLITTGCWDRVEINDLGIVNGVALDREGPNSIRVTVAVSVPARISPPGAGASGPGPADIATKSATGRTVMDAVALLQQKISRRIFWAHNQVILIGDDLARDGIAAPLEFFSRQRQPRLRTMVAVVEGKAYEVLAVVQAVEQNTPVAIREIESFHISVLATMRDLLDSLTSDGQEPMLARISIEPSGVPAPGTLKTQGDQGEDPLQISVKGAAVFHGDRLVGFLDEHETRGALWLRDELETATVTVTLGDTDKWVSFDFIRGKTRLTPHFDGDRIVMGVHVTTEDDLNENAAGVDSSDPEVIKLLEAELSKTIEVRIREAAEKVQAQFHADVFGFGEAVRRENPGYWAQVKDRWDDIFPKVELDVRVNANIRRTGMSAKPLGMKSDQLLDAEDIRKLLEGK